MVVLKKLSSNLNILIQTEYGKKKIKSKRYFSEFKSHELLSILKPLLHAEEGNQYRLVIRKDDEPSVSVVIKSQWDVEKLFNYANNYLKENDITKDVRENLYYLRIYDLVSRQSNVKCVTFNSESDFDTVFNDLNKTINIIVEEENEKNIYFVDGKKEKTHRWILRDVNKNVRSARIKMDGLTSDEIMMMIEYKCKVK